MDIATQGLASLVLVRGAWPRAPKQLWLVAIVAAVLPESEQISAWFGAAAYLRCHRTFTHSLFASAILAAVFTLVYRQWAPASLREKFPAVSTFALVLAVSILHLFLDVCGTQGAALFSPFSARRFAMDWCPESDPLVIVVLVGALFLPELFHLVSSEIGARDRRPRGRVGAIVGLAMVLAYVGTRAYEHSDVLAMLESRTYLGEFPRHAGAFPVGLTQFTWFGVVETDRSFHLLDVGVGLTPSFDAENAAVTYKPQVSPAIEAAQSTPAARAFLRATQFPAATVEPTVTGTRITFRDLRYDRKGVAQDREVCALVRLDSANRALAQEIVWVSALADP
jgi:membrane-bound metal-dependent hydrolase YbcI (DUF457 family)